MRESAPGILSGSGVLLICARLTNFWFRHPENVEEDEMEEDEDETEPAHPPAVPQIPERFRNGGQ